MPVSLSDVTFSFRPGEKPLFEHLSLTVDARLTGIVGRNGSGKTTLLHLLGYAAPSPGLLRQSLSFDRAATVADVLGVAGTRAALRRIEAGSTDPADFDAVGDDWDAEARALALVADRVPTLAADAAVLDRPAHTLSGGELVRLALAALELAGAQTLLLDEPTNSLDAAGRTALLDSVRNFPGQVIVVSHDVELLRTMDAILEVYRTGPTGAGPSEVVAYGGNYDAYVAQRDAHQAALARHAEDSAAAVKNEARDLAHVRAANAASARRGKAATAPLVRKGKLKASHADPTFRRAAEARRADRVKAASAKLEDARAAADAASRALRPDESIRIPVIDPHTPRAKTLLTLSSGGRTLDVGGGDRVALTGPNGSGKTTLVRGGIGKAEAGTVRVGYLDQCLELPAGTVLEAVASAAPDRLEHDTYELLSKFLITGVIVHRDVDTLSGGERFRVALARVLLASPPPDILVLDEPTNNLDLDSREQLIEALESYHGALLIISHDEDLLERLGIERRAELRPGGELVF
ncbi:ATP-binding cassette domain-containing protein [uncultured Corynebacterium sp.]|uniref:ATP-binding cassette domain-containing protein n=1 Tax=uncultured Corynebacterium sp. TaxID=159447 RepID=UPI0025CF7EEF|nr:ATP-binding cassette domain-containing protein [uncultured Corynebacterium sp.]